MMIKVNENCEWGTSVIDQEEYNCLMRQWQNGMDKLMAESLMIVQKHGGVPKYEGIQNSQRCRFGDHEEA